MTGWQYRAWLHSTCLHAMRALPQILARSLPLLVFCAGLGWLMSRMLGIDPMTAYPTSSGAIETIAIIAAATDKVDLSFVMAMQTSRFMTVLLIGPPIARLFASQDGHLKPRHVTPLIRRPATAWQAEWTESSARVLPSRDGSCKRASMTKRPASASNRSTGFGETLRALAPLSFFSAFIGDRRVR